MWPFSTKSSKNLGKAGSSVTPSPIFFTNTLSGKKENFIPIKPGVATMYSCGFTVYNQAHIGNIRPYIFSDLISRILKADGYHVRRVINITDVGHLVSDADEGEDKMEIGAKREGTTAEEIAIRYTNLFLQDLRLVNLDTEDILFPRATQYIPEQIAMVKTLEKKGFTYRTHDGIYFDVSTFPDYGKLGGLSDEALKHGDSGSIEERISLAGRTRLKEFTSEKRNPADFALWKFSPLTSKRQQEWSSPWGMGFPGWHLECSAMIRALLGDTIDIHTGGIDHIPVHHNNEIAQSESVLEHPFVHYWIHGAFLTIDGQKISKSIGNVVYLSEIIERGYHPLSLRYFFLQAHYRSTISFSWEAIGAANEALTRLWKLCASIEIESKGISVASESQKQLMQFLHDDIGTPQALALLWEVVRDEDLSIKEQRGVIEVADAIFGLSLLNPPEFARKLTMDEVPADIRSLVKDREKARLAKDFEKADLIRDKLQNRGYRVEDAPNGPLLTLLPQRHKMI
jgi:cysteinyl-tRNA synthetase